MNHDTYNSSDPEFLASCALDAPLTREQRAILDRALANSHELRREVEKLRRVADHVARWTTTVPEIDWEIHEALIGARVDEDAHPGALETVDGLVRAWGNRRVQFDEAAFAASVMDRIAPVALKSWRRRARGILRFAAPLAAAAVVMLAVSLRFFQGTAPVTVSVVSIGPEVMARNTDSESDDHPRAVVSFSRVEMPRAYDSVARPSFRFVSIGVSQSPEVVDDASPL